MGLVQARRSTGIQTAGHACTLYIDLATTGLQGYNAITVCSPLGASCPGFEQQMHLCHHSHVVTIAYGLHCDFTLFMVAMTGEKKYYSVFQGPRLPFLPALYAIIMLQHKEGCDLYAVCPFSTSLTLVPPCKGHTQVNWIPHQYFPPCGVY